MSGRDFLIALIALSIAAIGARWRHLMMREIRAIRRILEKRLRNGNGD